LPQESSRVTCTFSCPLCICKYPDISKKVYTCCVGIPPVLTCQSTGFFFESEFIFCGVYRRSTEADMFVTYYGWVGMVWALNQMQLT
jgi:hypothetical protein